VEVLGPGEVAGVLLGLLRGTGSGCALLAAAWIFDLTIGFSLIGAAHEAMYFASP
jgi:hypothetical protein